MRTRVTTSRVVAAVVALLAAGLAVALLLLFAVHGQVTPTSLAISVGRDLPGQAAAPCRDAGAGSWQCTYTVYDGSQLADATYTIKVAPGTSCWRGRLTALPPRGAGVAGWPRHVDGCVRRWQPW